MTPHTSHLWLLDVLRQLGRVDVVQRRLRAVNIDLAAVERERLRASIGTVSVSKSRAQRPKSRP